MNASRTLAEELTSRFAAIDGVHGIFPEQAAAAVVLALVTSSSRSADGLVTVDDRGEAVRISARLATSRAVPARVVLAGAAAVVVDLLGSRPYALDIEFAYID